MRTSLIAPTLLTLTACAGTAAPSSQAPTTPMPVAADGVDEERPATPEPPSGPAQSPEVVAEEVEQPDLVDVSIVREQLAPLLTTCKVRSPWSTLEGFEELESLSFTQDEEQHRVRYSGTLSSPRVQVDVEFDRNTCSGYVLVLQGEVRVRWRHVRLGKDAADHIAALREGVGTSQLVALDEATAGTRALHEALGLPRCGKKRPATSRSRKQGDFEVHSAKAGKVTNAELPSMVPSVAKVCTSKRGEKAGWVSVGLTSDEEPTGQSQQLRTWIRYSSWIDQSVLALPQPEGVRLVAMPTAGAWEQRGTTPSGLRWGLSKDAGRRGHARVPVVVDPHCGRVHALSSDPDDFTMDGDGVVTPPPSCPASDPSTDCRSVEVSDAVLTQRDCVDGACTEPTIDLDALAKRSCR